MDPRIVDVVRKKLDYLEQILVEIDPYLRASYADYARKPAHRRATERLVQRAPRSPGPRNQMRAVEAAARFRQRYAIRTGGRVATIYDVTVIGGGPVGYVATICVA